MIPVDRLLVEAMTDLVYRGEAECLALAMEDPGSLVLLDDLAAREPVLVGKPSLFAGALRGERQIPNGAPAVEFRGWALLCGIRAGGIIGDGRVVRIEVPLDGR